MKEQLKNDVDKTVSERNGHDTYSIIRQSLSNDIGKFFTFCLEKGEKGGKKLQAKAGRGLFVALLLFVGIPLPGTGAWTGTLAASLLDMDFKSSVIAVMCGVLLAGVIMALISNGVLGALSFML